MLRVEAREEDPLVSLEVIDALIQRRGLEVAPVEIALDLRDALRDLGRAALRRSGSTGRARSSRSDRSRRGDRGPRDQRCWGACCRLPSRRRPDSRSCRSPRMPARKRSAYEGRAARRVVIADDMERLVGHEPRAAMQREPRLDARRRGVAEGVNVAGQEDVRPCKVRVQIACYLDAPYRVVLVVDLKIGDLFRVDRPHRRAGHDRERGLHDGGDTELSSEAPRHRRASRRPDRDNGDARRSAEHAWPARVISVTASR